MEQETQDILRRLEQAVESWTDQVDQAQKRLGEQLAETRGRVESTAGAEALRATLNEEFVGLQRALEDCTEAIRETLNRVDAVERQVDEVRGEITALRDAAPAPQQAESAPKPERTRKVTIHAFDDAGAPRRMGEILVDAGLITQEQLETGLELQRKNPQRKLGAILVEQGFTGSEVVPQVLARQLRMPYLRLKDETLDPEAVALVTGRLAFKHACIPVRATSDTVALAMANPLDLIAIEDVERAGGRRVQPLVARESEIMAAIEEHYGAVEDME